MRIILLIEILFVGIVSCKMQVYVYVDIYVYVYKCLLDSLKL